MKNLVIGILSVLMLFTCGCTRQKEIEEQKKFQKKLLK